MNRLTTALVLLALCVSVGAFALGQSLDPRAIDIPGLYNFLRNVQRATNGYALGSSAIGTATKFVTVTASPAFVLNGQYYAAGTIVTTNVATMTGNTVPTGYYCRYLVVTDANGLVSTVQGRAYATDRGVDAYPVQPENTVVIGGVRVYAASIPFVPNTTALGSVTTTLYQMVNRPVAMSNL
jgi:hypothetical protein